MNTTLRRAWLATAVWFVLNAFGMASFIVRLPEVKRLLGVSNSTLGLSLFVASLGSLVAIRFAGRLAAKHGSSPVMLVGAVACAGLLPLVTAMSSIPFFVLSLCLFVSSVTTMDVAMNAHAVTIEHESSKLIMGRLHGLWSVGGIAGGLIGGLFSSLNVSLQLHGFVLAAASLAFIAIFRSYLLPATADIHEPDAETEKPHKLPNIFYFLGLVGLCAAILEGSASDWGAILITDEFGATGLVSALPYIVFQSAMVVGRFSSDQLTAKFGRATILTCCGMLAFVGLASGLLVGGPVAIVVAWFSIGAGASVVIPMVFSLAGSIAKRDHAGVLAPSRAVATVTGISYSAFMIGPPTIGLLADVVSLRWAMLVPALLALGVVAGGLFARKYENS